MLFDFKQAIISSASLLGIWSVWSILHCTFFDVTIDLLRAPFREDEEKKSKE